jgi:hypothetical protein
MHFYVYRIHDNGELKPISQETASMTATDDRIDLTFGEVEALAHAISLATALRRRMSRR